MFDAIITRHYELTPTYIDVFGATARWSDDHGWEQNFDGWMKRGQSRVFKRYHYYNIEAVLEDCMLKANELGIGELVEMIVVSPPVAAGLYVENVLTDSDFVTVQNARPCYFDIPNILLRNRLRPIRLRVAQNPGQYFYCGAADAHGWLL